MESRFKKDLNLQIELRHPLINLFCGRGQVGQSSTLTQARAVTYFHFYFNQNTFLHKYNVTYSKSKFISKSLHDVCLVLLIFRLVPPSMRQRKMLHTIFMQIVIYLLPRPSKKI